VDAKRDRGAQLNVVIGAEGANAVEFTRAVGATAVTDETSPAVSISLGAVDVANGVRAQGNAAINSGFCHFPMESSAAVSTRGGASNVDGVGAKVRLAVGAGLDFHPIEVDLHVAVLEVGVGNVGPTPGVRETASVAI